MTVMEECRSFQSWNQWLVLISTTLIDQLVQKPLPVGEILGWCGWSGWTTVPPPEGNYGDTRRRIGTGLREGGG